eukprot:TRINITY_DN5248_c0_g1_i1.p1 TRINITY_DN5248_c0_g1~~TRINITY_DN5248_c0_g1_i1.p1  ORF type:complete len:303 (-),score=49.10 TRINITY_DN5248_c0_g1_i1:10-918(-)
MKTLNNHNNPTSATPSSRSPTSLSKQQHQNLLEKPQLSEDDPNFPFAVFGAICYSVLLVGVFYYVLSLVRVNGGDNIKIPKSLEELKFLNEAMKELKDNHYLLLVAFYSACYILKQTFCLPGSIWLNLWGGSLFGLVRGFFLVSLLSTLGASSCFLISKILGRQLIEKLFPTHLHKLQNYIKTKQTSLWMYLLFLRLVPFAPNSILNFTMPIMDIPFFYFWTSCLLGLAPINFIGVQAGTTLSEISSLDDILTWKIIFKLLSIVSIGFFFTALQKYLMKKKENLKNKVEKKKKKKKKKSTLR